MIEISLAVAIGLLVGFKYFNTRTEKRRKEKLELEMADALVARLKRLTRDKETTAP